MRLFLLLPVWLYITAGITEAAAQNLTEAAHVNKIVASLQAKDSMLYASVFLAADSMAYVTLRHASHTSEAYERARIMAESPGLFIYQDSLIDRQAYELLNGMIASGEKKGIHWHDCVLSRYELDAPGPSRDETLQAIAQERFTGFIFIEDVLTQKQYALTVSDMMKIEGKWYGGELNYIFEAKNKDDYKAALKAEQIRLRKGESDTSAKEEKKVAKEEDDDEDINMKRKQVADRKLYTGLLDDEIPVTLYIRYLKGDCPETICSWEAIFKFGDQDGYSREQVTRGENGKWIFTEEETGGVLEVDLKGKVFTGIFTATSDKVDYDAKLQETPMSQKRLETLDAVIEKDMTR